jgi:hypothetical protein
VTRREIVLAAPVVEGRAVTLEELAPVAQEDQVVVAADAQPISVVEKLSTCHLSYRCRLLCTQAPSEGLAGH